MPTKDATVYARRQAKLKELESLLAGRRVALVHEYLTVPGGSEQVFRVFSELLPQATIFTALFDRSRFAWLDARRVKTSVLDRWPWLRKHHQLIVPLLPWITEQHDLRGYDLVLSDSHIAAHGVITPTETIHLNYCHTPIRYVWYPQIDPRMQSPWFAPLRNYLRRYDLAASTRPDGYIANSQTVAKRIFERYGRRAEVITPPVLSLIESESQTNNAVVDTLKLPPRSYFLLVTRLIDYKLPELVIDSCQKLGLPLIIIGRGPLAKQIKAKLQPSSILIEEHISNDLLAEYYRQAKALIFMANEDFGLVAAEAQSYGTPVIGYRLGGISEIVEAGVTGELVEKQDLESLSSVLELFDDSRYDRELIRQQATKFSRENFEIAIIDYIIESINQIRSQRWN